MFRTHSRVIAAIVMFFFTWTSGGVFSIAHAAVDSVKQCKTEKQQQKAEKTEERFSRVTEELNGMLSDPKMDVESKKTRLKEHKSEINALDVDIRKQFTETEKRLSAAKLPVEILERHSRFVKHYDDNLVELRGNIDRVENAKDKKEAETEIEKTRKHLETVKAPSHHQKLDPNNLPHRQPKAQKREPRLQKEEFDQELKKDKHAWRNQKRVQVASAGSLAGLLASNVINAVVPPTAADLAETVDVQLTPEIRAKALELGNNPVKIYEWVRNNIEFVPTWGSIQGAQMALQTKQGNSFDTSSLLIALLRAAGLSARYSTGTIELPIDKVMNWAGGFTDPVTALNYVASGGIPVKGITSGGKLVSVQMEHVWVEAWVDMIPSYGAVHKQGDTWIPLDAAFKQYAYTNGIDLQAAVSFDAQNFVNQMKSSATVNEAEGYVTNVDANLIQANMLNYKSQLQGYVNQVKPNATFADIVGKKNIIIKKFSVLSESMPYKTIVKGWKSPLLPDSARHKISFALFAEDGSTPEFTITKCLSEIAGKKITLSYTPASSSDTQLLLSYANSGASSLPAYLINVKPEFRIDGQVVAQGGTVTMGQKRQFNITMISPTSNANIISNKLTAGTYSAIVLDLGTIAAAQLDESLARAKVAKAKLEANDASGLTKDDIMGEFLHGTGLGYWAMVDLTNKISSSVNGVVDTRLPSEGMFTYDLSTGYVFGVPITATPTGFTTDIDVDSHVVFAKNGDKATPVSFMTQSGMLGSKMEAGIYDLTFNKAFTGRGVSTAHILEYANQQGIPVYAVNSSNINSVLPVLQVSTEVKEEVQNAVASGNVVTIPKTNVTKDGWTGTGYLITNPVTGEGAYRISGGLSGGGFSCQCFQMDPMLEFIVGALIIGIGVAVDGVIGAVVATAIVGFLIGGLSLMSALCQIDNNFKNESDRELLNAIVVSLYAISIIAGIAGIFGGITIPLSFAVLVLSIIASNTVTSWGLLLVSMRQSNDGI